MSWIPQKFKRNPFIVWGCIVATIVIFALLFGREEILEILKWEMGMPEGTEP